MDTQSMMVERVSALKITLRDAVTSFRLEEAESAYQELVDECGVDPDSDPMLPARVTLGIFDGRLCEMLQMLNCLGEDSTVVLGMKALCLQMLGDPLWEGIATEIEETGTNAVMRESMQALLKAREF